VLVASQVISGASNDELAETAAAIEAELTRRALADRDGRGRGEVVEERPAPAGGTYRLEKVRCGKSNCRCAAGRLHGPYWYLYQRRGGKLTSKYVGKRLPGDSAAAAAGEEG
jgi:hypothetical protein